MFSGSYLPSDVTFLVKVITIKETDVNEKEAQIQHGKKHYSEMISPEYVPSEQYLEVFHKAFARNKTRFASDILSFAHNLSQKKPFVLVSLLRAGTPIGVLLKRTLKERFQKEVPHYSISIIRDREIDENALLHITQAHPDQEIVFIDGWVGKGVINKELKKFIEHFNTTHRTTLSASLYVVSDIAYNSDFSITNEDYLIPSSALNSTVSGLVSRSILNHTHIKPHEFHGCKYYEELKEADLSLWYIEEMMKEIHALKVNKTPFISPNQQKHRLFLDQLSTIMQEYGIKNINHIKPGIGESTRVLLRRIPFALLVKDASHEELSHLIALAKEKKIPVIEKKNLSCLSIGIIKDVT